MVFGKFLAFGGRVFETKFGLKEGSPVNITGLLVNVSGNERGGKTVREGAKLWRLKRNNSKEEEKKESKNAGIIKD